MRGRRVHKIVVICKERLQCRTCKPKTPLLQEGEKVHIPDGKLDGIVSNLIRDGSNNIENERGLTIF